MTELVGAAKDSGADLVAFPELALTGRAGRASAGELGAAVARMQAAVKRAGIVVVFGMSSLGPTGRHDSGVVLGPDGALLTRYDALAVDERGPFEPGRSAAAMWFEVRGVPAVVTVGGDVLWNEIAELAAIGGAQIHCHLANDAGGRGGRGPAPARPAVGEPRLLPDHHRHRKRGPAALGAGGRGQRHLERSRAILAGSRPGAVLGGARGAGGGRRGADRRDARRAAVEPAP